MVTNFHQTGPQARRHRAGRASRLPFSASSRKLKGTRRSRTFSVFTHDARPPIECGCAGRFYVAGRMPATAGWKPALPVGGCAALSLPNTTIP